VNHDLQDTLPEWQKELLLRHRLKPAFLSSAQYWFDPLADALVQAREHVGRTLLVALNGSQGSGKSTLCAYLEMAIAAKYGLRTVTLSLDDFYFSRAQRLSLAQRIHPLFATRGVPGTHDMPLLRRTLDALLDGGGKGAVPVPRFDKATDNPHPEAELIHGPVDIVILEGWCIGARPQPIEDLVEPINLLESKEDPDGVWRSYINSVLARDFLSLYPRVDQWVMLQAPSFDCVLAWRREQEQKLASAQGGGTAKVMDDRQLASFVEHFRRLTMHCLDQMPSKVDHLLVLDHVRKVKVSRLMQQPTG
jgi:D-glycerate 3-kinase